MFEDTNELLKKIPLGEDSFLEFKEIEIKGQRVVNPNAVLSMPSPIVTM